MPFVAEFTPDFTTCESAYSRAMNRVATLSNHALESALDEVTLTQTGVEPNALEALAGELISLSELNWVIARRTLSHRKNKGERLTPDETGRWLRAAKLCALAEEVFGNTQKATAWLHKPRHAFDQRTAIEMMQTEIGAQVVEEQLLQLDSGYFA